MISAKQAVLSNRDMESLLRYTGASSTLMETEESAVVFRREQKFPTESEGGPDRSFIWRSQFQPTLDQLECISVRTAGIVDTQALRTQPQ